MEWEGALRLAEGKGIEVSCRSLNQVLKACKRDWQQAVSLCTWATEKLRPDVASCSILVSSGAVWRQVVAWLTNFRSDGVLLNVVVYNAALSARHGRWSFYSCLLQELMHSELQPDVVTSNAVISTCGRASEWQKALSVLGKCHLLCLEATAVSAGAALAACKKGAVWQAALALLRLGSRVGLNTMLGCASAWQLGMCLAANFFQWHLQPDLVSVNTLLASDGDGVSWRGTLKLAEQLQAQISRPNDLITCNAAIHLRSSGGWKPTLQLFEEVTWTSLHPSAVTFTEVLSACGAHARWRHASALFGQMIWRRLEPNTITLNTLTSACGSGSWRQALLARSAETANVVSYGAALNAFEKKRKWRPALALIASLRLQNLQVNCITLTTLVRALGSCGRWQHAAFSLQLPMDLDPSTLAAMTHACEEATVWVQALECLGDGSRLKLPLPASVVNAAISACAPSTWQRAQQLFGSLASLQRTEITFNAAISAAAQGLRWRDALLLLAGMDTLSMESNDISFSASINACEKAVGRFTE